MSGREFEPVAAFFPSIDRNLIRDLDRHLRATPAPAEAPPQPAQTQAPAQAPAEMAQVFERPDISGVVEAIETAGSSLNAMTAQIEELHADAARMQSTNGRLRQKLSDLTQQNQALEAGLRAETQKAQEAAILAAEHGARASALERELELALSDLHRVTEAINAALCLPHAGR